MAEILVSDVMTREPIVILPDVNLLECAKQMVRKKVGSFPIVSKKKLVGFISQQDILWALVKQPKGDLSRVKAIDISPKKIATIRPTATIHEAMNKMKKLRFERLPVISEGELVGMLTARDILNFHPEFYPELEEFRQIREESNKLKRLKRAESRRILTEGICEECGNHGLLERIDGRMVCESCMEF